MVFGFHIVNVNNYFFDHKGGLSSKEEMCQSFLMYYPKVELSLCSSQYEFYNSFEALGITNVFSKVFPAMRLPYNPNTWPV